MDKKAVYEKFKACYDKHIGENFAEVDRILGIRKNIYYNLWDFHEDDFPSLLVHILKNTMTGINQSLLMYLNAPPQFNEMTRIDFEFAQERRKELLKNYSKIHIVIKEMEAYDLIGDFKDVKAIFLKYYAYATELREFYLEITMDSATFTREKAKEFDNEEKREYSSSVYN